MPPSRPSSQAFTQTNVCTGSISHAASQHITDAAFAAWQSALEDDEDKAAVTAAVEAAAAALKALGNGPCAAHAEKLVAATTPLLKGEAACQVCNKWGIISRINWRCRVTHFCLVYSTFELSRHINLNLCL